MKQDEIVELLHNDVSPARLRALVERFGIDFDASEGILKVIRAAGADGPLLDVIKAASPRGASPLRSGAPGSAPAGTSPSASPPGNVSPHEPSLVLIRRGAPHRDFYLSRFEITNRQYLAFCNDMGEPKPEPPYWGMKDDYPVVNVTWQNALAYSLWLAKITGRNYRLPSEAEWEHAARGGLIRRLYPWGDENPADRSCFGSGVPCRIGSFKPNNFGLYDMVGSVAEWCDDPAAKDGKRPVRGGSWQTRPGTLDMLSISKVERLDPGKMRNDVGFRVARDP